MATTTVGLTRLEQFNLGLESTKGTLVPATHKWLGPVSFKFLDSVIKPNYPQGVGHSIVVEDAFGADAGTQIVMADTQLSVEQFGYILNAGIKAAVTSAGTTPFLLDNFALPSSSTVNDISTFSFQFDDGLQKYEAAYGFVTKFSVHGDRGSNNGQCFMNAEWMARKAAQNWTGTPTPTVISSVEPLHIHNATIKIDAVGTAAGTASASANLLISFNLDFITGWHEDPSASGRTSKDFGQALPAMDGKLTGKLVFMMTSAAVSEISKARTPTPFIVQLGIVGTGTRAQKFNLPMVYDGNIEWGKADRNGFHVVELGYEAGWSRTATAQGISMPLNCSASTTIS